MKLHKSSIDNEIYYYFLKSGAKRWMYRHKYYDALGKRKEKKKSSFKTEKAALRDLLEIKAATLNGQTKHIEHSEMTVSQWIDIWYETNERSWKETTKKQRKHLIKNYIKPLIGKYKLNTLNKNTYVREFINKLYDKGLAPSTISLYHTIFKISINAAIEDEIIHRNRFLKIPIELVGKLDNFLNPDELNLFLDAAKKYGNISNYTVILLLAYSGLRRGEAIGLKWKNINFQDKSITVERTRDKFGARSPKTKNSYRTIKIDDFVIEQLLKYRKWCIETKFSFGVKLDKENDFVFISYQDGQPVCHEFISDFFRRLYEELEFAKIELKRITPHGLRHTHASILITLGIPPVAIADRLGNTVEMIYRTYSHLLNGLEEEAVVRFGDFLENGAKFGAN